MRTVLTTVALLVGVAGLGAQGRPYADEYPAIAYGTETPTSRVEVLRARLAGGEAHLTHDAEHGYLRALLDALAVPVSSQMLVYSRTSLQQGLISPATPRAVYFADDVYVAWMQRSDVVEIAAMDPKLGPTFYTLEQNDASPRIERDDGLCLECHDTYGLSGGGVPRFLIGSGLTDEGGRSAAHEGWRLTTDATPLERRWGGWYVTGTHGRQTHLGNVVVHDPAEIASLDLSSTGNVTDLSRLIDTGPYLAPTSDIVALLVVEHQIHVQNVITRAGWEARQAEADGEPTDARLAELAEPLVRALLFTDEAPLHGTIAGTPGFREAFEARGRRDARGRSLRDMDLRTRLFRYPVSYLVHSDAFALLPDAMKGYVFGRIREALESGDWVRASEADRRAALEVLTATVPDFARLAGE